MPQPLTKLDPNEAAKIDPYYPPPAKLEPPPITKLTQVQRNRLLKKAGMQVIDLEQMRAVSEIGDFILTLGLYKIQAAKLVATQADIEVIYAKTVEVAKKCDGNAELQVQILQIQDSLFGKRLEAIKIGLKAGEDAPRNHHGGGGGNLVIPFPPNVAVAVNLNSAPHPKPDVK